MYKVACTSCGERVTVAMEEECDVITVKVLRSSTVGIASAATVQCVAQLDTSQRRERNTLSLGSQQWDHLARPLLTIKSSPKASLATNVMCTV